MLGIVHTTRSFIMISITVFSISFKIQPNENTLCIRNVISLNLPEGIVVENSSVNIITQTFVIIIFCLSKGNFQITDNFP